MNHRMWSVGARELRGRLLALVAVTWTLAALNTFTAGPNYRTGQIKGADFLHVYVLGSLAAEGRGDLLYDAQTQRAEQERLVPDSRNTWFVPIYGPQTALLFAGFARLPYFWAALVWALVTTALYGACVWAIWRRCPALRNEAPLVALAALGFRPFCSLVQHGQTSVLPLICLTLAYLALRADRLWWAGVALGSLIIKPQLGIAVAVVMLARLEWRIIGGAIVAILAQWGLAAMALGTGPLLVCFRMLRLGPGLATLLEPKPYQLHSLRAFFTLLLPQAPAALALYVIASAIVLALAVRLWRDAVPLEARYSAIVLASVLVAPHVGVYDLVARAPAFVQTAGESERSDEPRRRVLLVLLYVAYVVPLVGPLAAITHVQLSVPVFAVWLAGLHWAAFRPKDPSGAEAAGA